MEYLWATSSPFPVWRVIVKSRSTHLLFILLQLSALLFSGVVFSLSFLLQKESEEGYFKIYFRAIAKDCELSKTWYHLLNFYHPCFRLILPKKESSYRCFDDFWVKYKNTFFFKLNSKIVQFKLISPHIANVNWILNHQYELN